MAVGDLSTLVENIYEFVLGDETETQLLSIRLFDEKAKSLAYKKQADGALVQGVENCPYCAVGNNANKTRIWKLNEMGASSSG
jgi:hypothetical protein